MAELGEAQAQLDEKQRELDIVQAEYDKAMGEKQTLMDDADSCRRKMSNATALIKGLAGQTAQNAISSAFTYYLVYVGERVRWTEASKMYQEQINRLVGDILLATGFLSYAGPFNQEFRNHLNQCWRKEMIKTSIPFSDDLVIVNMFVDTATIGTWNLQGLPNDDLSIQNGLIVTRASRFPLLIDPQGQGKAWIKKKEAENDLKVTRLNHKYFRSHLEDALSLGLPLLIEEVGDELDPALDNVLEKNFIKTGSNFKVRVGDKEVDVMKTFQLYISTKLPNPAYTPEIYARTSVIDFTVTMKGLEDQLLGIVILTEKQELEAERTKLLEEVTANTRKVKELEDSLLQRLTSTQGSLVDDESLIEVLRVTKTTAEDVRRKLTIAADTELKINTAREEYRPIASRGSTLYFLIVEMSMVNVMYQTSLRQFLGRFNISMARAEKSLMTQKRIVNIIEYLTLDVFRYTARGLYERDKFTLTLLLSLKIALQQRKIRPEEFQIFIKGKSPQSMTEVFIFFYLLLETSGGAALDLNAVEPKPKKWIQDMTWLNLVELSRLPTFHSLLQQVAHGDRVWKHWYDSDAPEEVPIPDGYDKLDTFQRLLLVRSWCLDRCIPMASKYIAETMGPVYTDPVITNLESMLEESEPLSPMIGFLSMACEAISMGQGQEVHARRLIASSLQDGKWVLLQNCHLGLNFMDELLQIVSLHSHLM
ncbi:unnamed protein product [Dibothriocephalus latus]|uniref:Dynein heavy chain ATP-binding dynein motor region domain-containing protein n=1 Tax=Dibothriocephalus latus TaxID=60516 RepID=A0A3P7NQ83_DIBLA|nr:unnamed protein product [Dibothriocephalus latus]